MQGEFKEIHKEREESRQQQIEEIRLNSINSVDINEVHRRMLIDRDRVTFTMKALEREEESCSNRREAIAHADSDRETEEDDFEEIDSLIAKWVPTGELYRVKQPMLQQAISVLQREGRNLNANRAKVCKNLHTAELRLSDELQDIYLSPEYVDELYTHCIDRSVPAEDFQWQAFEDSFKKCQEPLRRAIEGLNADYCKEKEAIFEGVCGAVADVDDRFLDANEKIKEVIEILK